MRFSFDVCTAGTRLEDAVLDIVRVAGRARCNRCGSEQPMPAYGLPCTCGSFDRHLVSGDELRVKEAEVE